MSVIVVGKNSFLAGGLRENPKASEWVFLSHEEALEPNRLDNADVLINFALHPSFLKDPYDRNKDLDTKLASILPKECQYIALSSRMVYGPPIKKDEGLEESGPYNPQNAYGENKLAIEKSLQGLVAQDKLTILRLSNIFGFEPGRHTFFGAALKNLHTNKAITFDIAEDCVRDFLPRDKFTEYLIQIAKSPQPGIFNVGCGYGVECGQIANWIIEGYGEGRIIVTDQSRKGEFFLNMKHTLTTYRLSPVTKDDIRQACIKCGQELKFNGLAQDA